MIKLTPKQRIAVQLIAMGWSRGRVATQLKVDPATVSHWRRTAIFQAELEAAIVRGEQECVQTLRALKAAAVERLADLMESPQPSAALKAVEIVLARQDVRSETGNAKPDPSNAFFEEAIRQLQSTL